MGLTRQAMEKLEARHQADKDLRRDITFIKKHVLAHAKADCRYAKSNYCY